MALNAAMGFQKNLPTARPNAEFANAKSQNEVMGEALPDFQNLMMTSNSERAEELAKEQNAVGNDGSLQVGETKTDKEFRDMLEKMTGKKQDKKKNKLDKDDYLNLMVTQLKNQDPMKPMDNQEMATQLAQFNSVEQLIAINKTLETMNKQQSSGQIDKLTPYLGKSIEVNGDKIRVGKDHSVSGARFELTAATGSTTVSIKDAAGKVVRNLSLGMLQSGEHKVEWNGKDDAGVNVPDGQYTYTVTATSQDGKPLKAKQTFTAKVDSITDIANGGKLGTSSGPVEVKDILSIRAPEGEDDKKKSFARAGAAANATGQVAAARANPQAQPGDAAQTLSASQAQAQAQGAVAPATAQPQAVAQQTAEGAAPAKTESKSSASKEQLKQARAEKREAARETSKPSTTAKASEVASPSVESKSQGNKSSDKVSAQQTRA